MKQILSLKKLPLLVLACGVLITVAVAQSNSGNQKYTQTDTVPAKQKKIRDLDEALAEVERGEEEMQRVLKELDRDKMEADIRKAMKTLDLDMAKMKEDLAKAMKEIDMQKIQLDVQKAMKELDGEKLKKEVAESLAKVDMEKVKAEMEKIKEIDFSRMKAEMANIQPEIEKAMKEARVNIEKAREEITFYKNLVNALEKDGLLNKKGNYIIEYRNKQLTVNGKLLSAEAVQKYSEYLSGKDDFTLQKDEDGLNINKK